MRHRVSGRKLNRNHSHRKAMFRNMAASLIKTLADDEDAEGAPRVPGRIVTTVEKAKELRPRIEKLITLAKKAAVIEEKASSLESDAERGSDEWKQWRQSEQWQEWAKAVAPAVALRRRAFAELRDDESVDILFSVLAERFADRDGGYTRVVKLATRRLGDAGYQALIEFVGENDRVKRSKKDSSLAVRDEEPAEEEVAEESTDATPEAETQEAQASAEAEGTEEASSEEKSE